MRITEWASRAGWLLAIVIPAQTQAQKAIDVQSADQQRPGVTFTDNNNLRLDRGPARLDGRNVFNLTLLWEPPKIRSLGFVGRQILSNWQINGIARYTSGRPF